MYAYPITEALTASTQVKASILPALDVSSVVHWFEPDGSTRTGELQSLELIEGIWWGAALYELTPGFWATENRHAFNFFAGVGPEFPIQIGDEIWYQRGEKWQAAKVSDFYVESNVWFAAVEWRAWYGVNPDEVPLCEIHTTEPELEEDVSSLDLMAEHQIKRGWF